jgi:hypothetical protein
MKGRSVSLLYWHSLFALSSMVSHSPQIPGNLQLDNPDSWSVILLARTPQNYVKCPESADFELILAWIEEQMIR